MSFMLGSLMGGLFGGAQSVQALWKGNNDIQALQRQNTTRQAITAATDQSAGTDQAAAAPTPITDGGAADPSSSSSSSDSSSPAIGPVFDPSKLGAGAKTAAPPAATPAAASAPAVPPPVKSALGAGVMTPLQLQQQQASGASPPGAAPPSGDTTTPPSQMYGGPSATTPAPMTGQQMYGGPGPGSPAPASAQQMYGGVPGAPTGGPPTPASPQAVAPSPAPPTSPPRAAQPVMTGQQMYGGAPVPAAANSVANPVAPAPAPAPTSASAPAPANPVANPVAPPPAPPAAAPASLGSRIANALNPVSSAQAAEMPPRTAVPVAPAPAPGLAPNTTAVKTQGIAPTTAQGSAQAAVQPTQVAAQQKSQTPAPQAGPAAVNIPASAAPVAPGQTTPTTQSEATPKIIKPTVDPQYYNALNPSYKAVIDKIAAQESVTPQRLAATWFAESSMSLTAKDGAAGEKGIMQMLPGTHDQADPGHTLDPNRWQDSLTAAARRINQLDRDLGQDSVASVVGWQSGPGNIAAVAANPGAHPVATAYVNKIFGQNVQVNQTNLPTSNGPRPTMQGVVAANSNGGPDGVVKYVAQTAGGLQMTDAWRRVETMMTAEAASKGDWAGVSHARDFVLQASQKGMLQNTMLADQQLRAGNGAGAIAYLAKAHTFVPDGQMGQFGLDAKGNVWAHMVDESDPSRVVGKPFQVTSQSLQTIMNQSADPKEYVAAVNAQQKAVAENALSAAHTNYYNEMGPARVEAAKTAERWHDQATALSAQYHDEEVARQTAHDKAQDTTANAKIDAGFYKDPANKRDLNKEVDGTYGDQGSYATGDTPAPLKQRAQMAQVHIELRSNDPGTSAVHAQYISEGLAKGNLGVIRQTDGSYAVRDPKDPKTTLGRLSNATGAQFDKSPVSKSPIGSVPIPTQGIPQANAPTTTAVN